MSLWNDSELVSLFKNNTPLIDVRAPCEFSEGAIPGSVNLPLMNDEERKAVGICYKEQGQAAAIELGHRLVSGDIKAQRIKKWCEFINTHPSAEAFCFRGGLRSQISCEWMRENGFKKEPIHGGYKRLRHFFLSWINEAPLSEFIRIGGLTGSGKTRVLEKVPHHLDLERLANHRGSAFGPKGPQPAQITFENHIALELMKLEQKRIVVEDESVTLGKVVVPQRIFTALRSSPLILLDVGHEERLENIFHDYVKDSNADFFIQGVQRIGKRLGATKVKMLQEEIIRAFNNPLKMSSHEGWITMLLSEYYDPLYQKDLRYNQDKVIFQGNPTEVLAYLKGS